MEDIELVQKWLNECVIPVLVFNGKESTDNSHYSRIYNVSKTPLQPVHPTPFDIYKDELLGKFIVTGETRNGRVVNLTLRESAYLDYKYADSHQFDYPERRRKFRLYESMIDVEALNKKLYN